MTPDEHDPVTWSKIKTILKNLVIWYFVGVFMGAAIGGFFMYKLNDWLMYRTVKTAVMLYPDSEAKKDRIFDLKERL
jgi:hypothetical protein